MMDLAKPQVMDRPTKSVQHAATQEKGVAFVEALDRIMGSARSAYDEVLSSLPVPHRRVERWKYTPVAAWWSEVKAAETATVAAAGCEPNPIPGLDAYRMVFVNGHFDAAASDLPVHPGVVCMPLSQAPPETLQAMDAQQPEHAEWFAALNGKFASEGMYLRVEKNTVLDRPILVHHRCTGEGSVSFLRHDMVLGAHAQVKCVQWSSASEDAMGAVNILTRASIGENTRLSLDKVQDEGGQVKHVAFEDIRQARGSRADVHTVTIRGQWVRNDLTFRIDGEGSHAELNGIFLPLDGEFVDNHTTVDHRVAHCTSSENYKGILYGKSTGVFNGKVFVRPDAQQTNAYQQNANILASDQATMNAKPELEIYADDVKCSHGCTIGQFDNEALFYARSRGVGLEAAKAMLVHAFIGEVLQGLAVPEVRLEVEHRLAEKHQWEIWSDHPDNES
jgi:Fe-S cluster assembly protein SufD